VFAKWIPEALNIIESLERLPEPPSSLTITEARKIAANLSEGRPLPRIEAWKTLDGVGVVFLWDQSHIRMWPEGEAITFSS
jgi:hypothetical protein